MPEISKSGRIINLTPQPHILSEVLAECDGAERDTGAAGLSHRGESDGLGRDLFGKKRIHRNGAPKNTT